MTWAPWFPWWAASLLANVVIMYTEYLHRSVPVGTSWLVILPCALPFYLVAQFSLFHAFSGASHWLLAAAVFSVGNAVMRVALVSATAGHEVARWDYAAAGVAVMLAGSFLVKRGLT